MTPAEFIVFAGKLAAMGSGGEAAIRTIIGRAYYGTFHLTLVLGPAELMRRPQRSVSLSRTCSMDTCHEQSLLGQRRGEYEA
jgi:hypothetical protein